MKSIYSFLLLLIGYTAFSQSGQLDTSFGTNGIKKVLTDLYGYTSTPNPPFVDKVMFNSTGETVYLTNDIKTKAVTLFGSGNSTFTFPDFVSGWDQVTRFNDAMFNQYVYFTGFTSKDDNNKGFFTARLIRGTGSNINKWVMDYNFNIDGKVIFDTTEADEEAVAIKAAANGKIYVTGFSGSKGIIIRYTADGFLDKTFNQCGFNTFQIGTGSKPTSMVVQTDDKVVIAGNTNNGSDIDFFLTRYNADGSLDTSFGSNGVTVKDVNSRDNTANTMAIGIDGALYVAGKLATTYPTSPCAGNYVNVSSIFKYNSNGQMVTTFTYGNVPGAYIYAGGCNFECDIAHIIYNNGWIYGVGYQKATTGYYKPLTLQLNVDTPNGGLGMNLNVPNVSFNLNPVSLALKPSDNTFYAVMKYDNCTIGQTPFLKIPTNNYPTSCNNTSEASINFKKLIKTTTGYYGLDLNKKLFKMDSNFVLDKSFATCGYLPNVVTFAVDLNDKLICSLYEADNNGNSNLISRFHSDGKLDTSFNFYGKFATNPMVWINNIAITPQNDYLATKTHWQNAGATVVSAIKVKNSGVIDSSFGTNGVLVLGSVPIISSNFSQFFASEDIIRDSSGNYYTLIFHNAGGNGPAFVKLVKYSSNGILDATFGTNGTVDLNIPYAYSSAYKMNMTLNATNGKIVMYHKNIIYQLNMNGSFDTNFGTAGVYDVNPILGDFRINSVLVKGSEYFIGGSALSNSTTNILKINSLGVVDTTFGTNSGHYQESSTSNPNYVSLADMFFFNNNSILFYGNGIKKIQ